MSELLKSCFKSIEEYVNCVAILEAFVWTRGTTVTDRPCDVHANPATMSAIIVVRHGRPSLLANPLTF